MIEVNLFFKKTVYKKIEFFYKIEDYKFLK